MADIDERFYNPDNYVNRELSWLEFNYRILGEARDKTTPLFERLKFLSITASNLDEFFMVRVASLKDMVNAKYTKKDIAGLTAAQQLDKLNVVTHELVAQQYSTYNRSLLPLLKANGLTVVEKHEQLSKDQAEYVDAYFEENVYPVLTPMAVDSSREEPVGILIDTDTLPWSMSGIMTILVLARVAAKNTTRPTEASIPIFRWRMKKFSSRR